MNAKKAMQFCATTLLIGVLALPATAQSGMGVNARLRRQQERINQGVRTGELTPREDARLQVREDRLRLQDARYHLKNGPLTARERTRMEHELNHSSNRIYRLKHNGAKI